MAGELGQMPSGMARERCAARRPARPRGVLAPLALGAAAAWACAAGLGFVAGVRRPSSRTPAATAVLRALAPAAATVEKPFLQRTLDDVAAAFTAPYRLLRLSQITKEVVSDLQARRKSASKGKSSSGGSGGAAKTLKAFLPSYVRSHVIARTSPQAFRKLLNTSLNLIVDSISADHPYEFQPYHKAIRGPEVDHYAWGNDFFRSMVKYRGSKVLGLENVATIRRHLKAGDNVVLFANHQTEADPQVLSILLEREGYGDLAEQTIFVAGHKVTTDRLAVPFSMGRNLLTIFSKKYMDTFSEVERELKAARNRATVGEMTRLLNEGGHIFWVAPSGGRDRRSAESNRFVPAKFDEQSVGLFVIQGQKAEKGGHKTHFFPLAMWSHRLVPPPEGTQASVGEARSAARAPIGLAFGPELVPENVGGRKGMPEAAERSVNELYDHLDKELR